MTSELLPGKKVDFYYNKITWTKNEDGTITQLWEVFDKKDNLLQTSFKGIYKKKKVLHTIYPRSLSTIPLPGELNYFIS